MFFGWVKSHKEKQKEAGAQLATLQGALESAVTGGNETRVAEILAARVTFPDGTERKIDPNGPINSWDTVLHLAASRDFKNILQELAEAGANINYSGSDGITPLHTAARFGSVNTLRFLIEKGANINGQTKDGVTPLQRAAIYNQTGIAQLLTEKGATTDLRDNDGLTPLHSAARHGSIDVMKFLIEKGANLNAQATDGVTPLHRAVLFNQTVAAQLLIEKGAITNICDNAGKTPLDHAREKSLQHFIDMLSAEKVMDKKADERLQHNLHALDAILSKKKTGPETQNNEWEKIDDQTISRTKTIKASGMTLTEVFDFLARERITTSRAGGAVSPPVRETFDKIAEKAPLEQALAELQAQGGNPDPQSVYASPRNLKRLPGAEA